MFIVTRLDEYHLIKSNKDIHKALEIASERHVLKKIALGYMRMVTVVKPNEDYINSYIYLDKMLVAIIHDHPLTFLNDFQGFSDFKLVRSEKDSLSNDFHVNNIYKISNSLTDSVIYQFVSLKDTYPEILYAYLERVGLTYDQVLMYYKLCTRFGLKFQYLEYSHNFLKSNKDVSK